MVRRGTCDYMRAPVDRAAGNIWWRSAQSALRRVGLVTLLVLVGVCTARLSSSKMSIYHYDQSLSVHAVLGGGGVGGSRVVGQ